MDKGSFVESCGKNKSLYQVSGNVTDEDLSYLQAPMIQGDQKFIVELHVKTLSY